LVSEYGELHKVHTVALEHYAQFAEHDTQVLPAADATDPAGQVHFPELKVNPA